jgi:hypothetical protein
LSVDDSEDERFLLVAYTLNAKAIIQHSSPGLARWFSPSSTTLTLDDLGDEPTIYLLPSSDADDHARQHLRRHCRDIFEEQLDSWYRAPSDWPPDRSFDVFKEWFKYQFHSLLFDLSNTPVLKEADRLGSSFSWPLRKTTTALFSLVGAGRFERPTTCTQGIGLQWQRGVLRSFPALEHLLLFNGLRHRAYSAVIGGL